jgi:peptidoglycan/LPS O-acetylase OafA/YrhL
MIALFSIFVYFPNWLTIFENKLLSKIGISSYLLYLIHQNIGVIIIFTLGEYFLPLGFILPVLIIIVLIATSIFYTEKIDKKISFVLKNLIINKK